MPNILTIHGPRIARSNAVAVIIVRGKDNQIRAFHNICSHRGMKLVWDDKGRGGKFSCPYHAWIYNSDGELTNIPDEHSGRTFLTQIPDADP